MEGWFYYKLIIFSIDRYFQLWCILVHFFFQVEQFILFLINSFYFTILYWFCHTLTWIRHGCTCFPHPEPPSHLPPYPIPQGHPSAPALSTLFQALNLDWWPISQMVIYMFQCYSLKSSHPSPSPRVQKTVLYIYVSFAISYIGLLLLSF